MKKLFLLLFPFVVIQSCFAEKKHLAVGENVPVFSLKDQDGNMFNVTDYVGKKILVIYFYPKDESGVCTKEACSFRDSYADFTNSGAMVIGINPESSATHKKFKTNHNLPFTLLSDPDKTVIKLFGVKSKFFLTGRETFVIDLSGKIGYTYKEFGEGSQHMVEALKYINSIKK